MAKGPSAGLTGEMAASGSKAYEISIRQENAHINVGGAATLHTYEDTTIAGARLHANTLDQHVGGHMLVESRQDKGSGKCSSYNMGASVFVGQGGENGVGAYFGRGNGSLTRAWVSEQSAWTATAALNLDVHGQLKNNGAIIAAANNNLNVAAGTVVFADITDIDESHYTQATVGLNLSKEADGKFQKSTPTGMTTGLRTFGVIENQIREQITRATIGEGTITIRDPSAQTQDIAMLNRDVDKAQEITRDDASGVEFYASTSAVQEIGSGFEGIRGNAKAIERGIADGSISVPNLVRDFLATGQMGFGEFAELVKGLKQRENEANLPAEGASEAMAFAPAIAVAAEAATAACVASPACTAIVLYYATKATQDTIDLVYNNDNADKPGIGHNGGPALNDDRSSGKGPNDPKGMDPRSAAAAVGEYTIEKNQYSRSSLHKSDFFKGTEYTDKVRSQMRLDDFHSFPESVRGFQSDGTVSKIIGGDGVEREILRIPGSYRGKGGFFEFIKEPNGKINHRFFRANSGVGQ